MDTTYFGRKWGVMVLYDARNKHALTVVEVERETNAGGRCVARKKGFDTKHYLRRQKRVTRLFSGHPRADVPVSPNQNHRAPPDQEA